MLVVAEPQRGQLSCHHGALAFGLRFFCCRASRACANLRRLARVKGDLTCTALGGNNP
jgi:hypothetical protein